MASLHVPNGEDKFPDPKSMTLAVLGCGQLLLSLRNCPSPFAKETLTKASFLCASSHLAGITVDIQRRGLSRDQIKWVQDYMRPLKEQGLIETLARAKVLCAFLH